MEYTLTRATFSISIDRYFVSMQFFDVQNGIDGKEFLPAFCSTDKGTGGADNIDHV